MLSIIALLAACAMTLASAQQVSQKRWWFLSSCYSWQPTYFSRLRSRTAPRSRRARCRRMRIRMTASPSASMQPACWPASPTCSCRRAIRRLCAPTPAGSTAASLPAFVRLPLPYAAQATHTRPTEVKCDAFPTIDNGNSVCNGTDLSDVCSFACNHGFTIEGGDTFACADSLTWMSSGGCYNIPSTTTSTSTTTAKPTGTTTTHKGTTTTSTTTTTTTTLWTCPFPTCYGWCC